MTTWKYFLEGDSQLAEDGKVEVIRLPAGAPVSLAESVRRAGEWRPTDTLWKQKYQGSGAETTEISEERAQQILRRWVERGFIPKMPGDESSIPPDMAQRLVDADRAAGEVWRGVPTPPGAQDVDLGE